MNKLVSIIIPTYNAGQYIREALSSALSQNYQNFEIIVIDDGSTDDTEEIIKKYFIKDNIHYIQTKHSGLASMARNTGLKASKGHYIAFLDADDTWTPDKLKLQIELFDEATALVYSDGEIIGQSKKNGQKYSDLVKFYKGHVFHKLILKNFIATSSVVVKKSALDELGMFSENPKLRVGEDYDLWLRIAQKYKIKYSPKILFSYRIHPDSVTKNKTKAYKNISYLYKKWLKKNLSPKEKILFTIALLKNYLKIIYKIF